MTFEWQTIPLGALCLPGLRWVLRIHHLNDDENYPLSFPGVHFVGVECGAEIYATSSIRPSRGLWWFSTGSSSPKRRRATSPTSADMRVITHEVGLQPATAYFTEGEATAYPIHIPDEFEMNEAQNAKLDAYLAKRFQGDFTMAGIKFWADMKGLDEAFLQKAAGFKQIVPIFTNVIFDTSQPHANTVFEDMFEWLDVTLEVIRAHPETLFVIRAHPDELRVRKSSRETVGGWVEAQRVNRPAQRGLCRAERNAQFVQVDFEVQVCDGL